MMDIAWSRRAEKDLIKQMAFLEKQGGKEATTRFMLEVTQMLERIEKGQLACQLVDAGKAIR